MVQDLKISNEKAKLFFSLTERNQKLDSEIRNLKTYDFVILICISHVQLHVLHDLSDHEITINEYYSEIDKKNKRIRELEIDSINLNFMRKYLYKCFEIFKIKCGS